MATVYSNASHQEWRLSASPNRHFLSSVYRSRAPPHFVVQSARRSKRLQSSSTLCLVRVYASKIAERTPRREQAHGTRAGERATGGEASGISASVSGGGGGMGRTAGDSSSLTIQEDVHEGRDRRRVHAPRGVVSGMDIRDVSSSDAGNERAERKSREIKAFIAVDRDAEEKGKKATLAVKGKRKKIGKGKETLVKVDLRIRLDMCSKRGDVMGAISLYDSAVSEGVKLEQYHYNVLLYLCASAAGGVVHPAKSGNSSFSVDGANPHGAGLIGDVSDTLDVLQVNGSLEASNGSSSGATEEAGEDASYAKVSANSPCEKTTSDIQKSIIGENGHAMRISKTSAVGDVSGSRTGVHGKKDGNIIRVTEAMRKYALSKGFEIYEKMCLEEIPLSEAALTSVGRMAMSMGDGDTAFEIVKRIKSMGLTLRLRSYGPALFTYCNNDNIEKAFEVERHMVESGVCPEEPELQALLRVSIATGRGEKVYHTLHKLRTSVRQVSPATAELIETWFKSLDASRVGKRKWDKKLVERAFENGGGGWHGLGWLGKGKWIVVHAHVDDSGICERCHDKLVTIDLDPIETENFARSVAYIAQRRERNSSFQKFQKWLDYYGPFEAVIDAANVGLFSQRRFSLAKVNSVVNGMRQKLPSRRWPLVVVHNKRIYGGKADDPSNAKIVDKWKNADAIYTTPTGSNDDWYWLYAAIKCKSLIITNDEMRDHLFQVLGNDFFPKWKERHQVHFSFHDGSPEFLMPPPCSIVIQESRKGHWHIPIADEHESDEGRIWLCITRAGSRKDTDPEVKPRSTYKGSAGSIDVKLLPASFNNSRYVNAEDPIKRILRSLRTNLPDDSEDHTISFHLEKAEKLSGCVVDFQI